MRRGDCRCRMHPPCVAKRGVAVKGTALLGNVWHDIATRQACCDMCTNHPACTAFTYKLNSADAGAGSHSHAERKSSAGAGVFPCGCAWLGGASPAASEAASRPYDA